MYRDIILQIIEAAINNKKIDLTNYINDQEFMRIMKEQTFLPFLYKVDKRKELRKYYYQSCLILEKFNEIGKIVDDIFLYHIFYMHPLIPVFLIYLFLKIFLDFQYLYQHMKYKVKFHFNIIN